MPLVEEACLELVDLCARRGAEGVLVRVLVDKNEGGISLDECADLNRRIGEMLDGHEVIPGRYLLEVSSPGLDRNLKNARDFMRCRRKRVRFHLAQPVEGRLEYEGVVREVDEDSVTVEVKEKLLRIELGIINKARQII